MSKLKYLEQVFKTSCHMNRHIQCYSKSAVQQYRETKHPIILICSAKIASGESFDANQNFLCYKFMHICFNVGLYKGRLMPSKSILQLWFIKKTQIKCKRTYLGLLNDENYDQSNSGTLCEKNIKQILLKLYLLW